MKTGRLFWIVLATLISGPCGRAGDPNLTKIGEIKVTARGIAGIDNLFVVTTQRISGGGRGSTPAEEVPARVTLYDLKQPNQPAIAGRLEFTSFDRIFFDPTAVAMQQTRLFVADFSGANILVISIENPTNPQELAFNE